MSKKLKVITTEEAQADIICIVEYIARDNRNAAADFAKMLKKNFVYLSEFPRMGKRRPEYTNDDVLFFTVKYGYSVVYNVVDDKMYILRLLSEYQNFSLLF